MAITLHGYAVVPTTDDGTNTGNPTSITPPSSMQAGDLVVMFATARATGVTIAISAAGGQSWNDVSGWEGGATLRGNVLWCRFNGTWSTNPSVAFGSTTCNSITMLVFRPSGTSYLWALDQAVSKTTFTAPGSPYTVTITGQTTTYKSVAIAFWGTDDNNTWGSLSGTGWSKTSLPAQNRNSSGQDTSHTFAYNIQTSAGSTNNVSQNQATLGGDPGLAFIGCWYEYLQIVKVNNDTLQLVEGKVNRKSMRRLANEVLQLVEGKVKSRTMRKIQNEVLQLVDSGTSRFKKMVRVKDEVLQLVESALNRKAITKIINDTVQLVEGIVRKLQTSLIKVISETVQLVDGVVRFKFMLRINNEVMQLVDSGTSLLKKMVRIKDEVLQLVDSGTTRLKSMVRVKDEVVQLVEGIVKSRVLVRIKDEVVQLVENMVRSRTLVRIINDTVQHIESIVKKLATGQALVRVIDETLQLVDSGTTRLKKMTRAIGNWFNLRP